MKKFCNTILVFFAVLLIPILSIAQTIDIPISFKVVEWTSPITWEFPYSDEQFSNDATEYNHLLAQSSLGFAISSFRVANAPLEELDKYGKFFLEQAGFKQIESTQFNENTSINTVATLIAHKNIGETPVIAVTISGAGYKNEWQSNITITKEEHSLFHFGFAHAGQLVCDRIHAYKKNNNIADNAKIWITGFSRSAAISNVVAYKLLNDNFVTNENLYCYAFATPRYITDSTILDCPSIFNIVGAFDMVPKIPFSLWGYGRLGNTLYLPAQEISSDYFQYTKSVNQVYKELTAHDYWNSPQTNWYLSKTFQSIADVVIDANLYGKTLQDFIVEVMNLSGDFSTKARQTLWKILINRPLQEHIRGISLISASLQSTMAYETFQQLLGIKENLWNSNTSLVGNLAHEHCPDVYIAWLFSQLEPEELYSQNLNFRQVILPQTMQVNIQNQQGEQYKNPAIISLGEAKLINIPTDDTYTLSLVATENCEFFCYLTENSIDYIHSRGITFKNPCFYLEKGETVSILLPKDCNIPLEQYTLIGENKQSTAVLDLSTLGNNFICGNPEYDVLYSGKDATSFLETYYLLICGIITFIIIVLLVLIALLILIICLIVRAIRRKKKTKIALSN